MFLRMLGVLSVLAVAMATDDVTPRAVYPGIGEYFYIGVAFNWTEALLTCQASNALLTIIDSAAEADAIRDMMTNNGASFIHLGFSDQWEEGKYNDIFGTAISGGCDAGDQWAPGSPKGGSEFNCGGFSDAGFTDTRCGDKQVFICELGTPDQGGPMLPGYTLIPNFGYYKYTATNTLWTRADQACRDEGTHLFIINSQEEVDILMATFDISGLFSTGIHRYYGGNDNWRTVSGLTLNLTGYSRWYSNDEGNGYEPTGDFITYPFVGYHSVLPYYYGLWTMNIWNVAPFVCEFNIH